MTIMAQSPYTLSVQSQAVRPLKCSAAFAELLEYPTREDCLSSMKCGSPFLGYTLNQLVRFNPDQISEKNIKVLNQDYQPVGRLKRICHALSDVTVFEIEPLKYRAARSEAVIAALRIHRETNSIELDSAFGDVLGVTIKSWADFRQQILIEDRDWFEHCLRSNAPVVWLQFSSGSGDIMNGCFRRTLGRNTDLIEGTIEIRLAEVDRLFALQSLRALKAVDCDHDRTISLPRSFHLEHLVQSFQKALIEDWRSPALSVNLTEGTLNCAVCRHHDSALMIMLETHERGFSDDSLQQVYQSQVSQYSPAGLRLGGPLLRAHEQGVHSSVVLNNQGAIELSLLI